MKYLLHVNVALYVKCMHNIIKEFKNLREINKGKYNGFIFPGIGEYYISKSIPFTTCFNLFMSF